MRSWLYLRKYCNFLKFFITASVFLAQIFPTSTGRLVVTERHNRHSRRPLRRRLLAHRHFSQVAAALSRPSLGKRTINNLASSLSLVFAFRFSSQCPIQATVNVQTMNCVRSDHITSELLGATLISHTSKYLVQHSSWNSTVLSALLDLFGRLLALASQHRLYRSSSQAVPDAVLWCPAAATIPIVLSGGAL